MKNMVNVILLLGLGLLLIGCSNNTENQGQNSTIKTDISVKNSKTDESDLKNTATSQVISSTESNVTFENGVLETPEYKLTIDKTQVGHNNFTGDDGLIIWYTVKNKSEYNVVPQDLLKWFEVTQTDGTSQYKITTDYNFFNSEEALFPMYTEGAVPLEDDNAYNQAIEDQQNFQEEYSNKGKAELLPGKEVTASIGLQLQNTSYPVTFKLINGLSEKNFEYQLELN